MSMTLAARASHSHHISDREFASSPRGGRGGIVSLPRISPLVWFGRMLRARPGTTLAHCAFALTVVIILANALAMQRQDSPRSFIGEQAVAQGSASQRQAAIPMPPARPAEIASNPNRQQGNPPAATAPPVPAGRVQPATPATRDVQTARDPIGELIRSGQVPVGVQSTEQARVSPTTRPAADPRPVLAAQRALNRVGAGSLKADGVFGEETRAALERFERERRIPVTRDLSPRTLRELSAASGIRME